MLRSTKVLRLAKMLHLAKCSAWLKCSACPSAPLCKSAPLAQLVRLAKGLHLLQVGVQCEEELPGRDLPQLAARVQRLPAHVRHHHQQHLVEEVGGGNNNHNHLGGGIRVTVFCWNRDRTLVLTKKSILISSWRIGLKHFSTPIPHCDCLYFLSLRSLRIFSANWNK